MLCENGREDQDIMRTESTQTAVLEKNGSGAGDATRLVNAGSVPVIIRQMREFETVYAVVTPVKNG
jgi:hypothetical protein